jgi:SAM-dependent methyltransferase
MMTTRSSLHKAYFDQYAQDYDAELAHGLSVSGEDKNYFARGRVAWLAGCLQHLQKSPKSIIDFGCGTGTAIPFLLDAIGGESIVGIDNSSKLLEVARRAQESERVKFRLFDEYQPGEQADLVFCNGVFHHIPVSERASSMSYIRGLLRPGGLFALWENNPWNPGTLYVMSRIPFDCDAITLTPPETQCLMRAGGLEIVRTDFLFIFPKMLRWLRWIEPMVSKIPLGAQYLVLGRKPQSGSD